MKNIDNDMLVKDMSKENMVRVLAPGDGDCFYSSIASNLVFAHEQNQLNDDFYKNWQLNSLLLTVYEQHPALQMPHDQNFDNLFEFSCDTKDLLNTFLSQVQHPIDRQKVLAHALRKATVEQMSKNQPAIAETLFPQVQMDFANFCRVKLGLMTSKEQVEQDSQLFTDIPAIQLGFERSFETHKEKFEDLKKTAQNENTLELKNYLDKIVSGTLQDNDNTVNFSNLASLWYHNVYATDYRENNTGIASYLKHIATPNVHSGETELPWVANLLKVNICIQDGDNREVTHVKPQPAAASVPSFHLRGTPNHYDCLLENTEAANEFAIQNQQAFENDYIPVRTNEDESKRAWRTEPVITPLPNAQASIKRQETDVTDFTFAPDASVSNKPVSKLKLEHSDDQTPPGLTYASILSELQNEKTQEATQKAIENVMANLEKVLPVKAGKQHNGDAVNTENQKYVKDYAKFRVDTLKEAQEDISKHSPKKQQEQTDLLFAIKLQDEEIEQLASSLTTPMP